MWAASFSVRHELPQPLDGSSNAQELKRLSPTTLSNTALANGGKAEVTAKRKRTELGLTEAMTVERRGQRASLLISR